MRVAQILGAALVLLGCCSAANAPAKKGKKSGEQQQDDHICIAHSCNCSAKHGLARSALASHLWHLVCFSECTQEQLHQCSARTGEVLKSCKPPKHYGRPVCEFDCIRGYQKIKDDSCRNGEVCVGECFSLSL
jgi:hypothetical protein